MILTCPECATSYFVDDSRIAPAGRSVKCSNCGARWTARPGGDEAEDPAQPAIATAPPSPPPAAPEPDELMIEAAEPEPVIAVFAPRPAAPEREATGRVMVWAGAAAAVVALIAGALIFRAQVVRVLPVSQAAYAGIGLPVSSLVIEKVHAEPAFQGGRPVLAVTGQIRNLRDTAATVPSLRVSLLDRRGKPLAIKIARPLDPQAPAHAVRHFSIAIVDPPASVRDLEVTFEAAGAKAPPPARAAEAILSGPQPVDAQPLPPGSPDALPQHD
ncbi:MJ0042-type zinc finger domain-containing protein [Phenylobacterium sp.]|uniref:MJ0042-type zinc finger domain-containing protein n=1 Tax=Phenylobacterium sp. TaxID=1871053 RepID=UPI003568A8E9